MKTKILAVQLPAPCPLSCEFCRTPEHGSGNPEKVISAIDAHLDGIDEVYLTSNGETGLFPGFEKLVRSLQTKQKDVSVLCATKCSIVPGLARAEISFNQFTEETAFAAIEKAKRLEIPVILSFVDDGNNTFDFDALARKYQSDGFLARALQKEGLSKNSLGKTHFAKFSEKSIGNFPVSAYREIPKNGMEVICIDHYGNMVDYLGAKS